jgi:hypothetical protein
MIVVVMRGGLGNQMFQYAAGRALAERNGVLLLLDTTLMRDRLPRKQITRYNLDLDIFGVKPSLTSLAKVANELPVPGVWLALDFALVGAYAVTGARKLLRESDYAAGREKFLAARTATLWGYWQSEKYFEDIKTEIRKEFHFVQPLTGEAARIAKDIRNKNSVSLHVRRGDYTFSKYAKIYGGTDLAYYERAMAHVAKEMKSPHFFVFSNDVAWCEENLKSPFPMTYVPSSAAGPKAAFHLELMSLCKHNIIANSTFSWWGAWLNENKGKIVVAPADWYANGISHDIVPEAWTKL